MGGLQDSPLFRIVWEQTGMPLTMATQRLDVFHEWFEALMRPYLDSRHVPLHQ